MNKRNNNHASRRSKKKTVVRYLPNIILAVFSVIAVISVVVAVTAVVDYINGSDPSLNTKPSTTSPRPTTTQPTTKPQTQVDAEIDELIAKAEKMAIGYAYQEAIELLEQSGYVGKSDRLGEKISALKRERAKLIKFPLGNNVTHVFFNSLIVDTDRAFDNDEDSADYNRNMTTVKEFKAILQEMYDSGYVLVSPYDIAYEVTDDSGTYFKKGEIWLPEGKKPFLMSQDDVNYYSYMVGTGNGKNEIPIYADSNGDGFAHKIVIGEDGFPTCEYLDVNGNITTGDYDLVPILERFIQEHPDFSYKGARAILGVTGYEGVFGYRTKPGYNVENDGIMSMGDWKAEVEQAKAVAQCLRDHGWILASHSYGNPRYGDITPERLDADSTKWEETVASIIGKTDVILFPHGSDIGNWRNYADDNEKFQILYEDGYRYFFNEDNSQYWNQFGKNYFRGGRRILSGYRMRQSPDKLADLFDVSKVIDEARPATLPQLS